MDSGLGIGGVGNLVQIERAVEAVFRGEERRDTQSRREHHVDVAAPGAIAAGLVRDLSDSLALERLKMLLLEDIQTRKRISVAGNFAVNSGDGLRCRESLGREGGGRQRGAPDELHVLYHSGPRCKCQGNLAR